MMVMMMIMTMIYSPYTLVVPLATLLLPMLLRSSIFSVSESVIDRRRIFSETKCKFK